MTKFKVGDKVKVTSSYPSGFPTWINIDSEVIIRSSVDSDDYVQVAVSIENVSKWHMHISQLKHLEILDKNIEYSYIFDKLTIGFKNRRRDD